jgi:hypothetical protein
MIAEKKEVENKTFGVCPVCNGEDLALPHFNSFVHGKICNECFTKLHQKPLAFDEYDLQPDELTKEQVAEKLQCSLRNIEILKKNGKLPAQKLRRRVDGVVRSQLIFKVADIEAYKKGIDAPMNVPTVEKAKMNEQSEAALTSPNFGFDVVNRFAEVMNNFLPRKNIYTELTGKTRISVEELASVSGIAKSILSKAIDEAVKNGSLRHYTGERGKSVYRTDELEFLVDNLPPTPKQLPPKKKTEDL